MCFEGFHLEVVFWIHSCGVDQGKAWILYLGFDQTERGEMDVSEVEYVGPGRERERSSVAFFSFLSIWERGCTTRLWDR